MGISVQGLYKEILSERIIDFGINNKWTVLDKMMEDYDINIDEWDEHGKPRNPNEQLKPMFCLSIHNVHIQNS